MSAVTADLDLQLVERLRCPACEGDLAARGNGTERDAAICRKCGAVYKCADGIWRMLTPIEQAQFGSFLAGYPELRRREGWERDESYFLALPNVPPHDPTAFVWSIRRRSLTVLDRVLTREGRYRPQKDAWALDLGAGNGWLSRHLTHMGYRTVALDLTLGGLDSLVGAQLYMEHDNIWIGRVQASMSNPPLRDASFSLCTVSAALHYADLGQTLTAIHRVLAPGGLLAITDSPVYSTAEAGADMSAEREAQISSTLGTDAPDLPGGRNFLVESELLSSLWRAGFEAECIPIDRPLGRIKRRLSGALNPAKREQARFPVVIAHRK